MTRGTPAERLLARALEAFAGFNLDVAFDLLEAAQWAAEATGERRVEARAWTHLGRVADYRCDLPLVRSCFERASSLLSELSDDVAWSLSETRRAFAEYDLGDPEVAAEILEQIADRAEVRGTVVGYEGNLARSVGDFDRARGLYEEAGRALPQGHLMGLVFEMDAHIVDLLEGRAEEAARGFRHLAERDPGTEPLFTIYHSHYAVLAAALVYDERWRSMAEAYRAPPSPTIEVFRFAHACAGVFASGGPASGLELRTEAPSEHARLTLRILRAAFERRDATSDDRRLDLDRADCRMRLGQGAPVRFRAQSPAWRILCALSDATTSLTADALIEVAWPGEQILPHAARNRLHVTLAGLRRKGLEDGLVFDGVGYAIALVRER